LIRGENIMANIASLAVGSTTVGANYEQIVNAQGLGGRTLIVTIVKDSGDMTEAELVAILKAITSSRGTNQDAFTVAGISDFDGTDPVYVALQGTGTVEAAPVAGFTVATVAAFNLPH
jgi:hypothetical protein